MTLPATATVQALHALGEHFAAGYMEEPEAPPVRRWSRAVRRRFERRALPPYEGELLFPCGPVHLGNENRILAPSYSFTWSFNRTLLSEALETTTPEQAAALTALRDDIEPVCADLDVITTVHTVGGRAYTHSIPNYGRVLHDGLAAYGRRVAGHLERADADGDVERVDFYAGMQDVLAGVEVWCIRLAEHLRTAPVDDGHAEARRRRLLAALERAPFDPARTFFEALFAYNLVYFLDDCDNPGRVDQELFPYYERDLRAGTTSYNEAVELIRCLWDNCDDNNGWSAGIGGTGPDGEAAYNALTLACLEAARSRRRPNLQLHVRADMPDEMWDAALDTIATGCGLPALYNEEEYLRALRAAGLQVRDEDIGMHNGGGCTETMVHGCSNVGSLDAGLNLPLLLTETLDRHLAGAPDFQSLLEAYQRDVAAVIAEVTAQVSASQQAKARLQPQPMRSLLIDDCVDVGVEFNAGGARYNWSVINVAGLATVVDSLVAVCEVVFDQKEKTGAELLDILHRDFDGEEFFRRRLAACPRFGNDDERADGLAAELSEFAFRELLRHEPWRGGRFLPSCLMFVTYAAAGEPVPATPDSRKAGDPIADSAGPHQGRDTSGPTAMLRSVASIPHWLAPGTLVVNARFTSDFFVNPDRRARLRDLVRTYFDLGGMQLQINVVDQAILRDAVDHPERYPELIVRVGGYSEYFNRLSPELRATVLQRTEHGL